MFNRVDCAALNETLSDKKFGLNFLGGINLGKNLWGYLNSPKNFHEVVGYMANEYREVSTARDHANRDIWGC
ncbi:MAG: hypothetical protein Q4E13_01680 [Clostridia bacterium]|nr:hypothetical protein [Clostridia bacterium]